MNKLFFISLITLSLFSHSSISETFTMDDLVVRNDLYYKKFTNVPFTGEITGVVSGSFKNGKKDGEWVRYYDNGQLKHKTTYKNGKINGKYFSYRKTGELWNEGTMIMNKQEGVWKSFNIDGSYFKPYSGIFKNGNKIRELD